MTNDSKVVNCKALGEVKNMRETEQIFIVNKSTVCRIEFKFRRTKSVERKFGTGHPRQRMRAVDVYKFANELIVTSNWDANLFATSSEKKLINLS